MQMIWKIALITISRYVKVIINDVCSIAVGYDSEMVSTHSTIGTFGLYPSLGVDVFKLFM